MFKEELEATDEAQGMAFEKLASVGDVIGAVGGEIAGNTPGKFGKEDDQDSFASGYSMSRLHFSPRRIVQAKG